ncbi:MAG: hydrogenase maturation nickel metallochaperone HypA [Gammaproteobacteria bacterium]|nr:hydrogenase maturation nickel metallochaperone HypA [Gammaproteobacteria bacterium]
MHELNICLSLIRLLEQNAHQTSPPVQRIKTIWLEIGQLAGLDLDAIYFSFPIAVANTLAQGAKLKIITEAGKAFCHQCKKNVTIDSLLAPCALCGQYDYRIIQGKALRIRTIEVI